MVTTSQKVHGGTVLGRDIVLNALDLRHRDAREVMRPRQEISVFSTDAAIAECLEVAEKTRYSRFPLCERGDLDKTLGVDSAGVATLNVKFASTGEFYVRSLALPTTFNANSVWSPVERYHSTTSAGDFIGW